MEDLVSLALFGDQITVNLLDGLQDGLELLLELSGDLTDLCDCPELAFGVRLSRFALENEDILKFFGVNVLLLFSH